MSSSKCLGIVDLLRKIAMCSFLNSCIDENSHTNDFETCDGTLTLSTLIAKLINTFTMEPDERQTQC